jgi:hypothetical protein
LLEKLAVRLEKNSGREICFCGEMETQTRKRCWKQGD